MKTNVRVTMALFGCRFRSAIYRAFSANKAKDLVVRFDNSGIVTSYTFSTTDHGE